MSIRPVMQARADFEPIGQSPDPALIATKITEASPPFEMDLYGRRYGYIVSNDTGTGTAYADAVSMKPSIGDQQQAVNLIVGHGSFETATLYIPDDEIILFCDVEPLTLFVQRAHIDMIKECDTLDDFFEAEKSFFENLTELMFMSPQGSRNGATWSGDFVNYFGDRRKDWAKSRFIDEADDKPGVEPHFLSSEEQYQKVKERISRAHFAFYVVNLGSAEELEKFSEVLGSSNCTITQANLTNVLNYTYVGDATNDILDTLPWHEDAVVIRASYHKSRRYSVAYPIGQIAGVVIADKI